MNAHKEWIGVDLDGTLAVFDGWKGIHHIGEPIAPMVERVKAWIAAGEDVRIFTARVGPQRQDVPDELESIRRTIQDWCIKHIGHPLEVTCQKDFAMRELWDDRCVQVVFNTGQRADGRHDLRKTNDQERTCSPTFVFLDLNSEPWLVHNNWLHRWNRGAKCWVTSREIRDFELGEMEKRKLKPEHAALYGPPCLASDPETMTDAQAQELAAWMDKLATECTCIREDRPCEGLMSG